jgi:hypothetical protein
MDNNKVTSKPKGQKWPCQVMARESAKLLYENGYVACDVWVMQRFCGMQHLFTSNPGLPVALAAR